MNRRSLLKGLLASPLLLAMPKPEAPKVAVMEPVTTLTPLVIPVSTGAGGAGGNGGSVLHTITYPPGITVTWKE